MDVTFSAMFALGLFAFGLGIVFHRTLRGWVSENVRDTNRQLFRDLSLTRADRDFYKSQHDVMLCKLDEVQPLADLGARRKAAIAADARRRKDQRRAKIAA